MTKMTYTIALSTAISTLSADAQYAEVCEKLTSLRETIEKRNAHKGDAPRTPTKAQRENAEIKTKMVEIFDSPKTASEVAEIMGFSVQKASALLTQMVTDGTLTKTPAKGKQKATFMVADAE